MLLAAAGYFLYLNRAELSDILRQADLRWAIPAVVSAFASLILAGLGYALVGKIIKMPAPFGEATMVGFLTIAMNHIFTTGNAVGFAVRILFLKKWGVKPKEVVMMSLIHSYVNNIVFIFLLPLSIIYAFRAGVIPGPSWIEGAALFVFVVLVLFVTGIVFSSRFSRRVIAAVVKLARKFSNETLPQHIGEIEDKLEEYRNLIKSDPKTLVLAIGIIAVDWAFTIFCLYFCLKALGLYSPLVAVGAGFFISVLIGELSMIPGGFGSEDAVLILFFSRLGLSAAGLILVVGLFRIVYYLLPFLAALLIYFKEGRKLGDDLASIS